MSAQNDMIARRLPHSLAQLGPRRQRIFLKVPQSRFGMSKIKSKICANLFKFVHQIHAHLGCVQHLDSFPHMRQTHTLIAESRIISIPQNENYKIYFSRSFYTIIYVFRALRMRAARSVAIFRRLYAIAFWHGFNFHII